MSPWPLKRKSADRESRLICTVSTVKDSTANVIRFVDRNLRAGVDHMFIFLEGESEEIQTTSHALKDYREHVTPMRVGPRYWNHNRPAGLNKRQVINAGFVNCLLAPIPAVQWLFHIDGDECLDIDRQHLLSLPRDVPIVRLPTREAVSRASTDGEVDLFKRQLDYEDLCLLTILGVITGPANGRYFNGHTSGKSGLRPNLDLRPRIHDVLDCNDTKLERYEADSLHVLHYESYSGEEFVRKWLAHLSSGPTPKFVGDKAQLRGAIAAILRNPAITEERKQELLQVVYQRRVEDDVSTLDSLGLLVRLDPARHGHSPQTFTPQDAQAVRQLIELLRRRDKRGFLEGADGTPPVQLLREARTQLEAGTHLAERIDQCIAARENESPATATTLPSRPPSADPA